MKSLSKILVRHCKTLTNSRLRKSTINIHSRFHSSLSGFKFNESQNIPFGPFDGGDGPSALLNQNVRGLDMSATVGINEMAIKLENEGKKVHRFGFGQSPFPVPNMMVKELQKNSHQKAYLPVRGLPQLRECISNKINQYCGTNTTQDDVLVTPGSKEGIFCMQTAYYGELLLPAPSWVSYEPQARIIGRPIRWIQTKRENSYKVDASTLSEQLGYDHHRPRILILNSPGNPTGITYNENELREIAQVARSHRLIVLSDEIYNAVNHSGTGSDSDNINTHGYTNYSPSIAKYYPEGTIVLTGISKWCGAGGWRLGALVFPRQMRWLLDACAIIASETYTAASAPIQYGAIPAFRDFNCDEMQEYLYVCNTVLSAISTRFYDKMIDCGAECAKPNGAFYIFPDFSNVKGIENMKLRWSREFNRNVDYFGSKELTMYLLKECGITGLGGSYFGRPDHELTMRLSYVDFDGNKIMESKQELPHYIDSTEMDAYLWKYCEKTMMGITVLSNYMKSLSA